MILTVMACWYINGWHNKSDNLPIVGANAPTAYRNALANQRKLEQFDAVLEVRNADKSIIYLLGQEISVKQ